MLINWFTVGAQVVNFVILVALLKHFLYRPILDAINAREKRIADGLADAATRQDAAGKALDAAEAKSKAFEDQRVAMMAKAVGEAQGERERLLREAAESGEELRAKQMALLRDEQSRGQDQMMLKVSDEVFAIARSALSELADTALEERMGEAFVRRVRGLGPDEKGTLAKTIGRLPETALIRSRFELPALVKAGIQKALDETFSMSLRLRFETSAEGVCGIELSIGGEKLSWTIAGYLEAMKAAFGRVLDQTRPQAPAPNPKPVAPAAVPA